MRKCFAILFLAWVAAPLRAATPLVIASKSEPAKAVKTAADERVTELEQIVRAQQALLVAQARLTAQHAAIARERATPSVPPPNHLLPVVAASAGTVAVFLLLFLIVFRKPVPFPKWDDLPVVRELNNTLANLQSAARTVEDRLQKLLDEFHPETILTADHLNTLATEARSLRADLAEIQLALSKDHSSVTDSPVTYDQVRVEHEILAEHWKEFQKKELIVPDTEQEPWEPLVKDLGTCIPDDLKPSFDSVTAPWREHRHLLNRIGLIPRIAAGTFQSLSSPAAEVKRTRELASLLVSVQTPEGSGRLQFRFKNWITDTFLQFADVYLQRHQQMLLEHPGDSLQKGAVLVRQILRMAAVEAIEVVPGVTSFDSTRHIGRSTSSDPRFGDGVITGVVRNGFIEGGRQIIRQPEVIVNRPR